MPSDYYYSEPETITSETTSMQTTETFTNNILDYYYNSETESTFSQTTSITTTEHDTDNPDYKTDTKSNLVIDATVEPSLNHTYSDARRRARTTKTKRTKRTPLNHVHRTDIYIYDTPSPTPRNRHEYFYNKYHYGWRCKFLGHTHCVSICNKFFKKICSEVPECNSGTYATLYDNNCKFWCNITFYKPDFNKRHFVRTRSPTRRTRSTASKP